MREWFAIRVIYLWNSVPNNLRLILPSNNAQTLDYKFKRYLGDFLKEYFIENFKIYNTCTWRFKCSCHNCRLISH